jgi:hypothetical protein
MSASEKLKALDEAMTPAPWTNDSGSLRASKPEEPYLQGFMPSDWINDLDPEGITAVRNVFPQIVAVVEEMSGVVDNVIWLDNNIHNYGSDEWRGFFKAALRDARRAKGALAALDEALP